MDYRRPTPPLPPRSRRPSIGAPPESPDGDRPWTSFDYSPSHSSGRRSTPDLADALSSVTVSRRGQPSPFESEDWTTRVPLRRQASAARLDPRLVTARPSSPSGSTGSGYRSLRASRSSLAVRAGSWGFASPQSLSRQASRGGASSTASSLRPRTTSTSSPAPTTHSRGRRPEAPGERKYPGATARERLRHERSLESLRRLPSAGSGSSSPLVRPPMITADSAPAPLPPGRWTVPRQQPVAPPPSPESPRDRKARKRAELEETVRQRFLLQSASGRRRLMVERGGAGLADPLRPVMGPDDEMEGKAYRGGYSGLGIEKGDGWSNVPEFRKLLDEECAAGDMRRLTRANSLYLAELDSPQGGAAGLLPSSPIARQSSLPQFGPTETYDPRPHRSATIPFSAARPQVPLSGRLFSRRGSGGSVTGPPPSPVGWSHRPPPLDLSFSSHAGSFAGAPQPSPTLRPRALKEPRERGVPSRDHFVPAGLRPAAAEEGGDKRRRTTIKRVMKGLL